jgi:hypothetical protein
MEPGRKTALGFLHGALAMAGMMIAIFGAAISLFRACSPLFLLAGILMARGFLQFFHITPPLYRDLQARLRIMRACPGPSYLRNTIQSCGDSWPGSAAWK